MWPDPAWGKILTENELAVLGLLVASGGVLAAFALLPSTTPWWVLGTLGLFLFCFVRLLVPLLFAYADYRQANERRR